MLLKRLLLLLLVGLLASPSAWADTATTRDALDRLEELLELRLDDGRLSREELLPAILVSAEPRYEASQDWFVTRVIEVLEQAFGAGTLRLCEACMAPRALVGNGYMSYQTGPVSLDEVLRLDDLSRGTARPARSGIWVDEIPGGVSARIVDLRTGRVLFAQNVDPSLAENARSRYNYTLSEELERRARGDSITQSFLDLALYPRQHISLDWTEQWGPTNANLSGVSLSLVDPVLGVGAVHYRSIQRVHVLVGGQLVMSLPTALVRSLDQDAGEVIDPLLTGVGVVRVPFGRSNYGGLLMLSTNGSIGFGISLMNFHLLPVIP